MEPPLTKSALDGDLVRGEHATRTVLEQKRSAYFAFALYGVLAVVAGVVSRRRRDRDADHVDLLAHAQHPNEGRHE